MTRVAEHSPGSFCWIDLATSDQSAAKNFYGALFAWTAEDSPMGPNDFYTMFRLEGRDAAAAYTLPADQQASGVPPHWNLYVAVTNAEAAASRAVALGGKVHAGPFDVADYGRMAVIEDPAGARFSVWEAKTHHGIGISGIEGAFCVADLSTPDQERAGRFYSDLFGWRVMKEDEVPAHNYHHLFNGDAFIGGILPPSFRDPSSPPHWLIYFTASDCDAVVAKTKQLGGRVYLPPMPIEDIGRMAVLADPQGASFAVFQAR